MSTLRVVVADDSPFICRLLSDYLRESGQVEVVAIANDGREAVAAVESLRPDVVTLDLDMPGMDGLEALDQIMARTPTPAIMLSGVSRRAAAATMRALDLGAVDFIFKYTPGADTDPDALAREIVAKVRAASMVKVMRGARGGRPGVNRLEPIFTRALPSTNPNESHDGNGGPTPMVIPFPAAAERDKVEPASGRAQANDDRRIVGAPAAGVVVIGASTGGPLALRELLETLPADFPACIVVVQHMPDNFTQVLAQQLNRHLSLDVREAEPGDALEPGLVLVARGGRHLLVRPDSRIQLTLGPKIGGHRPSINVTMQSTAQAFGGRAIGVLLTGMGEDGALGLAAIRENGGKTYAQEPATCVVDSMPARALEMKVVDRSATPRELGELLRQLFVTRANV